MGVGSLAFELARSQKTQVAWLLVLVAMIVGGIILWAYKIPTWGNDYIGVPVIMIGFGIVFSSRPISAIRKITKSIN